MNKSDYKCILVLKSFAKINRKYRLNNIQVEILSFIMDAHLNNTECRVMEVIYLSELATPATLHKNLKLLINAGFVNTHIDEKDMRMKTLTPSLLAMKRLNEMESVLSKI
jgi:DNA-binding MarR family transcriptional regulator